MVKWDFSAEEMTAFGRRGTLPSGYLDALRTRARALNGHLLMKIEATVAPANAGDHHPTHSEDS